MLWMRAIVKRQTDQPTDDHSARGERGDKWNRAYHHFAAIFHILIELISNPATGGEATYHGTTDHKRSAARSSIILTRASSGTVANDRLVR